MGTFKPVPGHNFPNVCKYDDGIITCTCFIGDDKHLKAELDISDELGMSQIYDLSAHTTRGAQIEILEIAELELAHLISKLELEKRRLRADIENL